MDGTNPYQLYVQIDGRWQWICDLQASTHEMAFRKAMLCLKSEHYDKPIRLEQAVRPAAETKPEKKPAKKKPAGQARPAPKAARRKKP